MASGDVDKQLIDSLDDAIIALDLEQRITHWNAAATRLLGWQAKEILGMDLLLVAADPRESGGGLASAWPLAKGIRAQVEAGGTWRGMLRIPNRAGRRMMLRTTVTAMRSPEGAVVGFVASCQEIRRARRMSMEHGQKEEIEIDRLLRESEERFRALVELKQVGVFLVQNDRIVYASPKLAEILGYQQAELLTVADIFAPLLAEEAEVLGPRYRQTLDGEALPPQRVRLKHQSGEKIIVELDIAPTLYNSRPALIGTMLDVTKTVRADEALRESEATYRELLEALQEGVLLVTRDGRNVTYNQAAARLLGLSGSSLDLTNGAPVEALKEDGTPLPFEEWPLSQSLRSGQALTGALMGVRRSDGDLAWLSFNTRPLWRTSEETPYAVVASLTDITERRRVEAELQMRAFYDPLTGLPNRVLFFERADRALAQARRTGQIVAVGFVDLDTFKRVNDVLGHAAGDQLLQHVAQRLSRSLREGDTVARLGGDEFALLLPGQIDGEAAVRVAERVLEVLRQPLELDGHVVCPTASLGLSLFPCDGNDVAELLRKADAAMYQAKAAGRDRYAVANHSVAETLPRPTPLPAQPPARANSGRVSRRNTD
jgi:diguanylate cyclase (GGDEF)-like protein/PAS domain S-box-containing protein